MIVYGKNQPQQVWLFGQGLVGGGIRQALDHEFNSAADTLPYDWNAADVRTGTRTVLGQHLKTAGRVDVIWAAGRSGFGSSGADMDAETMLFSEICSLARAIANDHLAVTVHLISSAGGIFEGQTDVDAGTTPTPKRPYGVGKLTQEGILTNLAAECDVRAAIYRPSSVYGYQIGKRMGLIPTLIANALQDDITHITGELDTLRDYVLADDIGRFIAACIRENTPPQAPCLLTLGQSATISEVIAHVRSTLDVPLRLEFDHTPTNAAHISFDRTVHPVGWQPTALVPGIAHTAKLIRQALGVQSAG